MIDYKEYTKLRDIAQKRVKRGQAAGVAIDIHIPTVKELRQRGAEAGEIEFIRLTQFLESGFSLERRREAERPRMTEKQRRERKRQQSRRYRRQKVAREYAREDYPTKYLEYLKGLQTMHMDIPPSQLPGFFAYMDYRFSQGSKGEKKYVFDNFVDDFVKMLQKGYNSNQIVSDFLKFEADQALLEDRAGNMSGMNYEKAQNLWDAFIDDID